MNSQPTAAGRRVMLVGRADAWNLEASYRRAFEALGCQVLSFDIGRALAGYTRLGRAGRTFNQFVPVEPWLRKANRDMVLQAGRFVPDLVVTIGSCGVRAGALAQIRSMSRAVLSHIWPDTLLNLENGDITCLPIYDVVATYSETSCAAFQKLGAARVLWLPLAADPAVHAPPAQTAGTAQTAGAGQLAEVSFIGGWRPEREAALSQLGEFDLKIWGPLWARRCPNNQLILRAWQKRPLFGAELAAAVFGSKINLNIIDPTNFPAANMRFFEIPAAAGLQVASACPEMAEEFRHGEEIFYYERAEDLPGLVRELLADEPRRARVAAAAHAKVLAQHTYTHRARRLLEERDLSSAAPSKPLEP